MEHLTVHYHPESRTADFAAQIRDALLRSKIVVTTGVDPTLDQRPFWDEVSEQIGGPCFDFAEDYRTGKTTGGKWQEIRYNPDIQNAYRYSKNAQPLHTDGSYMKNGPEIVFFYCIRRAPRGGATVFIDSADLVEILSLEAPDLLRDLRGTPVHFSKAAEHKTRPILAEDAHGLLLTWNYYCVDPSEPDSTKALAERFHGFLQARVVGERRLHEVLLAPGEAVFFYDERLLHGRDAFEAARHDDRYLLKSAFHLDTSAPVRRGAH
jgi:alpha-ketoglutarate-dependent taurine dioxygenase